MPGFPCNNSAIFYRFVRCNVNATATFHFKLYMLITGDLSFIYQTGRYQYLHTMTNSKNIFATIIKSTGLAERLEPRAYLDVLNAYFECTAGAVLAKGGEVLLLIGDAVIAIFPTEANEAALRPRAKRRSTPRPTSGDGSPTSTRRARHAVSHDRFRRRAACRRSHVRQHRRAGAAAVHGGRPGGERGRARASPHQDAGPAHPGEPRLRRRAAVGWESLGSHEMAGIAKAREVFSPSSGEVAPQASHLDAPTIAAPPDLHRPARGRRAHPSRSAGHAAAPLCRRSMRAPAGASCSRPRSSSAPDRSSSAARSTA